MTFPLGFLPRCVGFVSGLNRRCNIAQWENLIGGPASNDLPWHPEDHRGALRLRDDATAIEFHRLGSRSSVVTHSCENDRKKIRPDMLGRALKQSIH
jgi:hypothetical protein